MNREEFLKEFFGDGNGIGLDEVARTSELQELTADLTDDLRLPVVLPRRTMGREVHWFVLCRDDVELRRAQTEVQGFVGPSYAYWEGTRAKLDPNDPVENAVIEHAGGRVLRFRTKTDEEFVECWKALKLMRQVWRQRPMQEGERILSGAGLLREFELAIRGGDTPLARECIVELRRRGLLGPENIRFLEIREQAASGRWREISDAGDLADLTRIRRPWLVTEDLITALYRVHIGPFEDSRDLDGALHAMESVMEENPELFTAVGPLRSSDVIKAFALRHRIRGEGQSISDLADMPGLSSAELDWVLFAARELQDATTQTEDAESALANGDLDRAVEFAINASPSASRVEILIECALQLRTLRAAEAAFMALDELDQPERAALTERKLISGGLNELESLVQPSEGSLGGAPDSWTTWLDRLMSDPDWHASDAVAICGELEYSAADVLDLGAARTFAGLLESAAESHKPQAFRDALPHIVGWLERQDVDDAILRPVHQAILTVLAVDDAWGGSALEVAYNVSDGLLRAGVDREGYKELLENLSLLWERMVARSQIVWLADILELLLEVHSGDRAQLAGFVAIAIGGAIPLLRGVDQAVLEALRHHCITVGAEELSGALANRISEGSVKEEAQSDTDLSQCTVGIYTLSPQVAVRARDLIERRFPGVEVKVDSSLASTDSLENLARSADYLIVSVRSAKHAATDAIDRNRPPGRPTLFPRGRGSSRMVEALVQAVESRDFDATS